MPIDPRSLQNMAALGNPFDNQLGFIGGGLGFGKDTRTDRQKLEQLRAIYCKQREELDLKIIEIDDALEELDKQPMLEKLNNLIRKILG